MSAPRTETEALVCSLWAGILKLERVGIYDNFFELGRPLTAGYPDCVAMREAFRVEIPLRLLFEQPTVAGLTQSIEAELAVGRKAVAPHATVVTGRTCRSLFRNSDCGFWTNLSRATQFTTCRPAFG